MNTAQPADWRVDPNARAVSDYNSNLRFLPEGESTVGVTGELYGSVGRYTERSMLLLEPRVLVSRNDKDENLDYDSQRLAAQFEHDSERWRWDGSASFTRDTTLTSEIGLTGFVEANKRHEAISLSTGPTVMLTERANLGAQLSTSSNHYRDARNTGLVDYRYHAALLSSGFAFSEATGLTLQLHGGRLEVPDNSRANKEDAALRLGWSYKSYSLWSFDASLGPSYVKSDFSSDTGSVFQLGARRRAERWAFNGSVSRDVRPTGQGALTRNDQVSLGLDRWFTERLRGGFAINGIRNNDQLIQARGQQQELEYARADLSVNWQLAEHWSLAFVASGATQKYDSSPTGADNYSTSIGIVWNGQPHSL